MSILIFLKRVKYFMADFAENLKELRAERGLTLKQVADATGISINGLSQWENRKRLPNANAVIALAKFFNVTAGQLLGTEEL